MPAATRSKAIVNFWRFHRWLYALSDGRIGSRMLGHQVLKLTTTGRRSREPRSILIYYFEYEDSFVIVASNAGAGWHPAWYLNLEAKSEAEVQVGRRRIAVVARTAVGDERAVLWSRIVAKDDSYSQYDNRTEREIPVVVLDPVGAAGE